MKVTKITIQKELMDLREGQLYMDFVKYPKFSRVVNEGEMMLLMENTAEIERFEAKEIFVPSRGGKPEEMRKYLVKVDDRKIFDELNLITQSDINILLQEQKRKLEIIWEEELGYQLHRIKNLPWYKRLFNKF